MHPPAQSFADIVAPSQRLQIFERELPKAGRRSWFYRVFIAPFVDMDHRAVWRNEKLGGGW